ncbi:hypothetical protein N566_12565 [Streptomycetaceae bacterium MP113-05]|nr:hypothetical protein N566_12565 [Streptomycetaceae bacterium MP113-05]
MYSDSVLLESRSARSGMTHHVEILDRVKTLALAPDGEHATTRDVAAYFEVSEKAVYNLASRHREELEANGLSILQGSDLQKFATFNLKVSKANANSYPQRQRSLAVYTRRTVLNVAMLLRDSEVARRVRAYLLDVEKAALPGPRESAPVSAALEPRVAKLESAVVDIGTMFQELGPVIHRMSVRMERIDRRMVNTERLVCEMSRRMTDMGEDMRVMRTDLDGVMRATGVRPTLRSVED